MLRRAALFLVTCFLLFNFSDAQPQNSIITEVYGKVIDGSDKQPLPYGSVRIGKFGAVTNDKGEYSIEVDEYDELTFSYVGYTSQVIRVNSRQSINVVFEEADRAM